MKAKNIGKRSLLVIVSYLAWGFLGVGCVEGNNPIPQASSWQEITQEQGDQDVLSDQTQEAQEEVIEQPAEDEIVSVPYYDCKIELSSMSDCKKFVRVLEHQPRPRQALLQLDMRCFREVAVHPGV